jgi:hypothetical protein
LPFFHYVLHIVHNNLTKWSANWNCYGPVPCDPILSYPPSCTFWLHRCFTVFPTDPLSKWSNP